MILFFYQKQYKLLKYFWMVFHVTSFQCTPMCDALSTQWPPFTTIELDSFRKRSQRFLCSLICNGEEIICHYTPSFTHSGWFHSGICIALALFVCVSLNNQKIQYNNILIQFLACQESIRRTDFKGLASCVYLWPNRTLSSGSSLES